MKAFFLALLCYWCIGHAQGRRKTPLKPLAELLLAPAGNLHSTIPGQTERERSHRTVTMQKKKKMKGRQREEGPKPFDIKDMAGISAPFGFFDPLGFSNGKSEGKIRFYRESELKHGRVAMLASIGFLVAEQFHPLFGGRIDVPSFRAVQELPQEYIPRALFVMGLVEVLSIFTFNSPFPGATPYGNELWTIRSDYEPGDFGFDPLLYKPKTPEEYKIRCTQELNNGRTAMLAMAVMVLKELITQEKLFDFS
jgi:hypothetical protein